MVRANDKWVTTALNDDRIVVELLLCLKHAGMVKSTAYLSPLRWGSRQPRSRVGVSVEGFVKKEMDNVIASPVTPLCWSGGSDGLEASCSTSIGIGSKAAHATTENTSNCSRRSKKNKKIANVKAKHQERSVENRSLKRIKLEYSERVRNIPISKSSNLDKSEEKGFLFLLPDLNMTPTEEAETLYGIS